MLKSFPDSIDTLTSDQPHHSSAPRAILVDRARLTGRGAIVTGTPPERAKLEILRCPLEDHASLPAVEILHSIEDIAGYFRSVANPRRDEYQHLR